MKNSKVVSFLSPFKVGQAGNLWTLPRKFIECGHYVGMNIDVLTRDNLHEH